MTHGGNAIVNFFDLFVTAHPMFYGHVIWPIIFSSFYLAFSVFYVLIGGTDRDYNNYIYSVIDWKNNLKGAIIFSFLTIAFLSIMHFILTACVTARIYVHKKWFQKNNRSEINQDPAAAAVDNIGFIVNV